MVGAPLFDVGKDIGSYKADLLSGSQKFRGSFLYLSSSLLIRNTHISIGSSDFTLVLTSTSKTFEGEFAGKSGSRRSSGD